jgi:hypothetical protein
MNFFKALNHVVREGLGKPMTLIQLLNQHPTMRVQMASVRTVAADRVAQWQNWGGSRVGHWSHRRPGTLLGWRHSGGSYSSFQIHRQELQTFGGCEVVENWSCDIQDVTGLSSSKSKLDAFDTLDGLVETNSPEMIDEITDAKLRKNLAHDEIRILHDQNSSDHFARYLWDDGIWLMNSGGSHHFAAARYIAARINQPVRLQGRLKTYSINKVAIAGLRRDFDIYAIPDDPVVSNGFHEAMSAVKATYLTQILPRSHNNVAVFLPKNDLRSVRVSKTLGEAKIFNLGEYLTSLAIQQAA